MPTKNTKPSSARKAEKKTKVPAKAKAAESWPHAGKQMADIRLEAGITQVAVAIKSGLGQNRSSAIEKSPNLNWRTMNKVASACRSKEAPKGFGFLALPRDLITQIAKQAAAARISPSAWLRRELTLPSGK